MSLYRELVNQRLCAAHPHIIHLREAFLTPHHLGIAMEYADGGDLLDFIDTFAARGLSAVPEVEARRVFQQMMVAVDYCHRLGVANRDIKVTPPPFQLPFPLPLHIPISLASLSLLGPSITPCVY